MSGEKEFRLPLSLGDAVKDVQENPSSVWWITDKGVRIAALVNVDMVPVLEIMAKRLESEGQ